MTDNGFTRGPWIIVPDEEYFPAMCIQGDGFDIATTWGGYLRAEADAHLIAAAPDLFAALEALVAMDDAGMGVTGWDANFAAASAALAKARGL